MKKDSIIILSHWLTPHRELSDESVLRVNKGLELFRQGLSDNIIMNGGPGMFTEMTPEGIYVPRGTHPVQCDVMKDYAISCGIPEDRISVQDYSGDSVGEAYFVKEGFLEPNSWKDNIIITSNYHTNRIRLIYDHILGPQYHTEIKSVKTPKNNDIDVILQERKSIRRFLGQFGDIMPGDSKTIEDILYSRHTLYSKIPKEQQRRYFK